MKPIEDLQPLLLTPKRVVITHHFNPDADAVGSSLALNHYLTIKGHVCTVVSPNEMPDFLMWMPGALEIHNYDKEAEKVNTVFQQADILFCLDFNHSSRTNKLASLIDNFQKTKVLLDHHLQPDTNYDYGKSEPNKSSTCEMIYDFINSQGDNELIDLNIAKCIYAGAMTDTGSFKYSCTTASVHTMVADLINKGLETNPIHVSVFDNFNENRLRLLGYLLSQKMQLIPDCHASIISLSRQEMLNYNIASGDTEGIVNYPLSLKSIILSIFISEKENEIRMSFRSKGNFDVNQFAREYFFGGGHINAAGGKSTLSLTETIQKLTQHINEYQKELQLCYQKIY